MEIIDRYIHEKCIFFDTSGQPAIELVTVADGKNGDLPIRNNEVVFFLEGRLRFIFSDFLEHEGVKGHMLFLPAGGRYYYEALEKTVLLIFRIIKPIQFCEHLSMEEIDKNFPARNDNHKHGKSGFNTLKINTRIEHLLKGVADCLEDGVRCRGYFNLKIKEFFLLLRIYYAKKDICDFLFYLTLSEDAAFSEHVRRQWHLFKNVKEIAESMWMTPRKFSAKFKEVFGQTAYSWMKENRANLIRKELTTTNKLVKQIAFEQGFDSKSQFTKFCTKELGENPTEIRAGKSNQMRELQTQL
ncbi:helix-turn-helix transcriptional regulator [uncultured Proteiniphilum sp.]|uniref:helix-turn-helix transcriptional regulator n=1 Tax=uncultured Proteiniphilum sp. TaxID=497637 RepID=UPI0026169C19|nr:helix-turn-helix transcriptional regulator [uncultured Proteiniphilum sp.]